MKPALEPLTPDDRDVYRQRVLSLEAFGHRGSATKNERLAANYLAAELKQIGLHAETETFIGCRSNGGRFFLHLAVAVLGLILAFQWPLICSALALVALFSLWAEQTTRHIWLSRPLVRCESQNVVATIPATETPRMRIVVSGHYDTQRTGLIWSITKWLAPLQWRLPPILLSPLLPLASAMAIQILVGVFVYFCRESISSPYLMLTFGCLIAAYLAFGLLLGQMAIGPCVPGAADNASGAAAVLSIGEAWLQTPVANVELVLLLTGCEETVLLGSSAWIEKHRSQLQSTPTVFLNIDCIGMGPTRILSNDGPVFGVPAPYPRALLSIAKNLADKLGITNVGPYSLPGPTDGLAFLKRGIPGISVVGFQDGGRFPNYHQMSDTSEHLDFESAYRSVQFGWLLLRQLAHTEDLLPGYKF